MPKYRIDSIGELARQMGFTPLETRRLQLESAEQLLHEIDPARGYPPEFVVYRITGFRPKIADASDFLAGIALQHDLGTLIEQVSQTLNLHIQSIAQPVLCIDDVTERFNVTSKTIQRWRCRGLPARRLIFNDGKRRVGFLLSSVERFVATHRDELPANTNFSAIDAAEHRRIIEYARRLAIGSGCWPAEIARRIGRKLHRSPLTILHTIRKHDSDHSAAAVFPLAPSEPGEKERASVLRRFKHGWSLRRLSRRFGRPSPVIGRMVLEERVARLNRRKIRFIHDPLYDGADAEALIADIVTSSAKSIEMSATDRLPLDLPNGLKDLCRAPLLSASRERALFLKFNFHKSQFATARRRLDPQFARSAQLNLLEGFLHHAASTRNEILQANLRLLVSVARKHVRAGVSLMELISDGNLTLMRAVEGFDVHKGYRFSTYATLALMKGFARSVPAMLAQQGLANVPIPTELADERWPAAERQRRQREEVQQLLGRLNENERRALKAGYGLNDGKHEGRELCMSPRKMRQLQTAALGKLRGAIRSPLPPCEK